MSYIPLKEAEREARLHQRRLAFDAAANGDVAVPLGYRLDEQGLTWADPVAGSDEVPIFIASPFEIVAETRDGDGMSWGVLLRWRDHDGRDHLYPLPRAALAGDGAEARRILLDGGLCIAPGRKARELLNSFLLQVRSPGRARATQSVGWHDNSFVLPDECFGADERDTILLQGISALEHSFQQSGTLESWQQQVGRYATGNSRLVLSISTAFAGPLIGPCSAESGGIHLKGPSSIGKSTALHTAGSVWGGGDTNGFVRSWRATSNGLEGIAALHSDTLLCLDELSQLTPQDGGEVAYMLANGSGKTRSTRDGLPRRAMRWRSLFLSSGEIGLADKVAEQGRGRRLTAGQQVRVVDVPADAGAGMGMFENLHGFPSGDALARHLRDATKNHFGVAARKFLAAIVPAIEEVKLQVIPITQAFVEQFVPAGADGQIERVARRFALVAVAGELAQRVEIVPWQPGEAIEAAGKCFSDWLQVRGGHDAAEDRDGVEQVRAFLLANGEARFIPAWEGVHAGVTRDLAGYRRRVDDGWDYYVTTDAWKEVCAGLDRRRAAAMLKRKGYLVPGEGSHLSQSIRVPGFGKRRLFHICAALLEDANEA